MLFRARGIGMHSKAAELYVERRVGSSDMLWIAVHKEPDTKGRFDAECQEFVMTREQGVKLRDALSVWIGDAPAAKPDTEGKI